jgi:hypothetical protein
MKTLILSLLFAASSVGAQRVDPNIYVDGGIRRTITGPSDTGGRLISMKLYCDKDASGYVYAKLGIFDVTDPFDSYGQYFSFAAFDFSSTKTFPLDDRTPGHRNYVLSISPRTSMPIKFGRPGYEDQISTSRDNLLVLRAQHAIDKGTRVTIGSKEFLVIPQQGTLPGFVFFTGDLARRLASGDSDAAYESFCVKTMRRTGGGGWEQERGPLLIGEVDGRSYELAFNPQTKNWVIQNSPE